MSDKKNGRYEEESGVFWYKDGVLHREDGPAIEYRNGTTKWYLNGKRHREDGPAAQYTHFISQAMQGSNLWFLDDIQYTEEEFNEWLAKKKLNEKLQQKLEEKPAIQRVKI